MRKLVLVSILLTVLGCAKINENPTSPSQVVQTPPPPIGVDKIEFRVFGAQLFNPINIQYIEPTSGTTFASGNTPYFASVTSKADDAFLFIEAKGFGMAGNASTLQVQIFVNGTLFREGISSGTALDAVASGTWHRQ